MIEIKNVRKSYAVSSEQTVNALSEISLYVGAGEFTAIVGASGSGKTTLMNIIGCLDRPTSGEYFLDGMEVGKLSQRELSIIRSEKISFVFQGYNLIQSLSAAENIELPLIYRGIHKAQRLERVYSSLSAVGLLERAEHKPFQLSGGQQQRVAIARAFAMNTPVILADEPCGNLDSKSGMAVMEMLCEMNRRGKTIVLITHDEKAALMAQRQVRISDGAIVS